MTGRQLEGTEWPDPRTSTDGNTEQGSCRNRAKHATKQNGTEFSLSDKIQNLGLFRTMKRTGRKQADGTARVGSGQHARRTEHLTQTRETQTLPDGQRVRNTVT